MIQEFRAEPIQLLQVHHLKVQVHRLLEVNQLKSNQVIDSNYFYNPNYTIKSVKNQYPSYLEQATGIEPASQAWEACILTIVLCLQKGNTKIYCLRAKPVTTDFAHSCIFYCISSLNAKMWTPRMPQECCWKHHQIHKALCLWYTALFRYLPKRQGT